MRIGRTPCAKPDAFQHYIEAFKNQDEELYPQHISNAQSWEFLRDNVPMFECPDKQIEEIYYFRWWTYRKHIKSTPDGFIITEFLPQVGWAGKHNSISCPAGHHIYEGRWLHDPAFLNDYTTFWFRCGRAAVQFLGRHAPGAYLGITKRLVTGLLDDLVGNYRAWEKDRRQDDGLFWRRRSRRHEVRHRR